MMTKFDDECGCVLGYKGSGELAQVIEVYIKGMTTQHNSDTNLSP